MKIKTTIKQVLGFALLLNILPIMVYFVGICGGLKEGLTINQAVITTYEIEGGIILFVLLCYLSYCLVNTDD